MKYALLKSALIVLFVAAGCNNKIASSPSSDQPNASAAASGPSAPTHESKSNSGETAAPAPSSESTPATAAVTAADKKEPDVSAPQAVVEQPSVVAEKASVAKDEKPATEKKERDVLFKDWPQPKFVLVMTGQQMGYLEPCGCTGLVNQKGGLARRHTLVRQLTDRGWPVVAVDAGNQIHRFGRQSEIKFQNTIEALKKIGYQAIAFGVDDLRVSAGELAAVVLPGDGGTTPFVCANAAVIDRELTPTHQIVEAGGKKIGITAVLGSDFQSKIIGGDLILTAPEAGLDAVMPKLKEAKCDLLVLLAHASIDESKKLAEKYRDFQVVVTADGVGEPEYQPEIIGANKAAFVKTGIKGMYVGVMGFFDDPQTPWRYEKIPLDDRFEDSKDMLAILTSYQEQLKTLGFDGLGLKAIVHPSGYEFVGSEKCGECHSKAFAKWKETPHSHATESLIHPPERSEIARHFDPECLSCHVTGWNPQKFFPYSSGFLSLEKTPLMVASGCENCHGPGSAHVAAESGEGNPNAYTLAKLRAAMRLRLSAAEAKCMECHDIDNSPDFHSTGAFEKYWKKVEHKGLD